MRTKGEREPPVIAAGSELREAWKPELFAQDHNYSGFSGPKSDHDRLAMMENVAGYVQGIIDHALVDLGSSFGTPELQPARFEIARIIAFNPMSWDRDDVVTVELPSECQADDATVVDERGAAMDAHIDGNALSIMVRDFPALGYRCCSLAPSPVDAPWSDLGSWLDERSTGNRTTIESPYYRLVLSPSRGCIERIVSRKLDRHITLADGPRSFAELVSYEDPGPDVRYRFTGAFTRDSAGAYTLRRLRTGPLSATWILEGAFNHARIEKLVTLCRGLPFIDLEIVMYWWGQRTAQVRLCLPFAAEGYAETWYGVPFHAVRWPTIMAGISDAAILGMEANPDELSAEDRRHFREIVQWIDVGYREWGVTVAVKLPNMWIDANLLEIPLVRGSASCGDPTVWPDNSGRRSWRLRLLSHDGDWRAARAWRTGWEFNSPIVARALASADGSALFSAPRSAPHSTDSATMPSSFFRIAQDNVVVTALKTADDGSGDAILRYYEANGTAGTVTIECFRSWPRRTMRTFSRTRSRISRRRAGGSSPRPSRTRSRPCGSGLLVPVRDRRELPRRRGTALRRIARLDDDAQTLGEPDGIHDVPPVQAVLGVRGGIAFWPRRGREAGVGVGELGEAARAADIRGERRATDLSAFAIPVDEERDPTIEHGNVRRVARARLDSQVRSHVLSAPPYAVQDRVGRAFPERIGSTEPRVEAPRVSRHITEGVVDLVVDDERFRGHVLDGEPARRAEGHRPPAVQAVPGIHADGKRGKPLDAAPAAGEVMAHGALHGRLRAAVPRDAEDGEPRVAVHPHPEMLYLSRSVDRGEKLGLRRLDRDRGRHLPATAEVPRRGLPRAGHGPASLAGVAARVLGADRPARGRREPREVTEVQVHDRIPLARA